MPSRRELANAIRALSMDAVQQANSGHPGAPMGMADIAESLWNGFLRHNPANPHWADRDRFVLSNGHGSMLLYSLLHLSGYALSVEDLKAFRQLGSKTPGHPEYGMTPGVETTTGPLGQGLANAVGMAIAEKTLAAHFNKPGHSIVDHHTYVFLGDGCLMEGISHEVCSLAGTLGLGKLIAFYDDNGISIDGDVEHWFADDTAKRFEAYGWQVLGPLDGHDGDAVAAAIEAARAETARPSLIVCKTIIGFGAPNKQGGHDVHGAPLGKDEVAAARAQLGWEHPPFVVPAELYAGWDARQRGAGQETEWNARFAAYRTVFPALAAEFERRLRGELPKPFAGHAGEFIAAAQTAGESIATRVASQRVLNAFGPQLPELFGGSADLTPSNNTFWKGAKAIRHDDFAGDYINYGVREFGMSAVMNGMALHGGFIPYGGTFLVFSDYARNALRVAALAKIPSIFVYTHDSIGLGEDGPTHQPIEQLASLRVMPGIAVWRPCDAVEAAVAWQAAIERRDGPSVLVFSRQNLPHQARDAATLANVARGGYVLVDCQGSPELILIATGSEIGIAVTAATELSARGVAVRVVSLPCTEVFEAQDAAYRESVLPNDCRRRVVIEAGATAPWYKYVGLDGRVVGLDRFGESAPAGKLFEHFGFTVANVVKVAEELL
ncbi:transketolase [Plasticicumulans acidivorans]|uniref:Transketolase n=1 Tax=Plasticicumulans acidivorans TaxID=886464 RepID=A0A317MYE4_9GAMM|nr:transketolase [Plasticicumulans acidivorans]PWV64358.1 transketolase [Plasticicumulans acidivorans]